MNMDLKAKDYLGDGIYCGFDGYQVWLWASNGTEETEPIALEPGTLIRLNQYAERVRETFRQ
jgi:hypothetical protein